VAPRTRIYAFGSAAVLVVAGALCAVFVNGLTGQLLTIALMLAGFGGALLLIFLEVGLSEDRDRAREEERRREPRAPSGDPRRRPSAPRWPRRPG
jgi:zinc transporter ZupT